MSLKFDIKTLPPGSYWMLSRNGKRVGDSIEIDQSVYESLKEKPRTKAQFMPVPLKDWPLWAQMLKMKATPEDKGVGDTVARLIGPETSKAFEAFYVVTFGKPCGCKGRQAKWNLLYPLK